MSVLEYLCVEYLFVRLFRWGGGGVCVSIDSGMGCMKAIRHVSFLSICVHVYVMGGGGGEGVLS